MDSKPPKSSNKQDGGGSGEAKSAAEEHEGLDESASSSTSLRKKPPPQSTAGAYAAARRASPPHRGSTGSSSPAKAKRQRETNEDDAAGVGEYQDIDPAKLSTMSRSERKRCREKKRRSDVNKGFDDLMNLLVEIDPEVRAEADERARRGQWKGGAGVQEDSLLSRVDLIGRTVAVLRRLHQENEQRKLIIDRLVQEFSGRSEQPIQVSQVGSLVAEATDLCTHTSIVILNGSSTCTLFQASTLPPQLNRGIADDSLAARLAAARSGLYQPWSLPQQLAAAARPSTEESLLAGHQAALSPLASSLYLSGSGDVLRGLGGPGLSGLTGVAFGGLSPERALLQAQLLQNQSSLLQSMQLGGGGLYQPGNARADDPDGPGGHEQQQFR